MKYIFVLALCFFAAGMVLFGCAGSSEIATMEPQTPLATILPTQTTIQHTEQQPSQIKQTEVAILATQVSNQSTPTTFKQSDPWFSPLISFAVEPDRALARQIFPSGTKQIYAMWEYGNMRS